MADERILVVEDELAVAWGIEYGLKSEGFQVLLAENGQQALDMALSHDPHLLLLDIRLPEISWFDVCRKLRSEGSSIPIIMLAARDEELNKVLGLELGADVYVVKPYTVRELVSHIREKLRRAYGEFATMSDDDRIRFGFSPIVVRPRPDIPYGEAAAASMRDRDHSMMESVLWQLLFEEYQETILEFLGEA